MRLRGELVEPKRNVLIGDSKFLGDLGVPLLPGSFLDVLSQFGRNGQENGATSGGAWDVPPDQSMRMADDQPGPSALPIPAVKTEPVENGKGKGKETGPVALTGVSRVYAVFTPPQ